MNSFWSRTLSSFYINHLFRSGNGITISVLITQPFNIFFLFCQQLHSMDHISLVSHMCETRVIWYDILSRSSALDPDLLVWTEFINVGNFYCNKLVTFLAISFICSFPNWMEAPRNRLAINSLDFEWYPAFVFQWFFFSWNSSFLMWFWKTYYSSKFSYSNRSKFYETWRSFRKSISVAQYTLKQKKYFITNTTHFSIRLI